MGYTYTERFKMADEGYRLETQQDLFLATHRARETLIKMAREDPAVFVPFVMRDERTGKPIEQTPMHDEWQDLLSTYPRLVIWSHIEAGKTFQIPIGRTLWEMGRNPALRCSIISNTAGQAEKIMRSVAQYIEKSEELHLVFPNLVRTRNKGLPWNSTQITIERSAISKDPTMQACGMFGNILGARLDRLVFDDILDPENIRTEQARDLAWSWVRAAPFGRLTADARVAAIGNAWHPNDAMHRMAQLPRFVSRRYAVLNEQGEPRWPARWSKERIESARQDFGPMESARQLMCISHDDAEARFKRVWIEKALELGEGWCFVDKLEYLPEGYFVVTGVDLAVQSKRSADKTVFVTILVHPDGTRQILNIWSGRIGGPEIVSKMEEIKARFGGVLIVENVGAQDYIIQFASPDLRSSIIPFTTGSNKTNPTFGVESLGAELAAGMWIIPAREGKVNAETEMLIAGMLAYHPAEHTADHLMGMWFAREGARSLMGRKSRQHGLGVRVIG